MRDFRTRSPVLNSALGLLLAAAARAGDERTFATSPGLADPRAVPRGGEFELTLDKPIDYGLQHNFRDVEFRATFTSPSNQSVVMGGFYCDTRVYPGVGSRSFWKIRFAPREVGAWTYRFTFTHTPSAYSASGTGQFTCIPSSDSGFVRVAAANPMQLETEDGVPFHAVGTNENTDKATIGWLEGGAGAGPFVAPITPIEEVYKTYAQAGFNLIRFNQGFAQLAIERTAPTPWDYQVDGALTLDHHVLRARQSGRKVLMTIFGNYSHMSWMVATEELAFLKYFVRRYAARVDIWQVHNERVADTAWYQAIRTAIRAEDPYQHPVAAAWYLTSNAQVQAASTCLDLVTPHCYSAEDPTAASQFLADKAREWRSYGKPVVATEFGNATTAAGDKSAWTPQSPLRWRIKAFTALMFQLGLVPWNSSGNAGPATGSAGSPANLYLGREERQYIQVVQRLATLGLRPDSAVATATVSDPARARAFALASGQGVLAYVHHYADHTTALSGVALLVDVPVAGRAYFLDPATGAVLGSAAVAAGAQRSVALPSFTVDLAVLVTGAPLAAPPVALVRVTNPQWDGDLDNDGVADYGPAEPPFGQAPLNLTLDASSSHDIDGGALTFRWDFGDGTPAATGARVSHSYTVGTFVARVTVTDDEGRSSVCAFAVRSNADAHQNLNDAPVPAPLMTQLTVREGEPVVLTPWAEDDEIESVTAGLRYVRYSSAAIHTVLGMPDGCSFGTRGATWLDNLMFVPDFGQAGSFPLTFQVQDPSGARGATRAVQLTVLEANDLPQLVSPSVSYSGSSLDVNTQVVDPNGEADIEAVYAYFVHQTQGFAGWIRLTDTGGGQFRSTLTGRITPGNWVCWLLAVDRSHGYAIAPMPFVP